MSKKSEYIANFVRDHQDAMYRIALSYVKDTHLAMDVVQETAYKSVLKAEKLRDIAKVKTWVYRILVNTALDVLRRNKRTVITENLEHLEAMTEDVDTRLDLYSAINQLESKYRQIIVLRYYEDFPFKEIAKVLGLNINTVKSQHRKAIELLKYELGGVTL